MGRIAAHTQEQVFDAADQLAASGQEVTATTLREVLGRGSFSTLGRHLDTWQQARKASPAPVVIDMPESVKIAFGQCWQAAAAEAGREIAAIREKTDTEIQATKRRLTEALAEIERLEKDANDDAAALEAAQTDLEQTTQMARRVVTDAAAREAALAATAKQMQQQIESQQDELARVHAEADAARRQYAVDLQTVQGHTDRLRGQLAEAAEKLEAASIRERAKIEEAVQAQASAARLTEQLKDQKMRSVEVIGKLEKSKQALEADLTNTRKEARTTTTALARAQGELDVLRSQVTRLNDTLRGLATGKKGA